jgi:hypothetical protein
VPLFRETRELLGRRAELRSEERDSAGPAVTACEKAMEANAAAMKDGFPLDAAESGALRRELKRRVAALHEAEVAALRELGKAVG